MDRFIRPQAMTKTRSQQLSEKADEQRRRCREWLLPSATRSSFHSPPTPFPTVRCLRNRRLSRRQDRPKRQLEIGSPRSVAATATRHVTTLRDAHRRTQVRISRLSARNELANLSLTPF
jgi:hypothetical protein